MGFSNLPDSPRGYPERLNNRPKIALQTAIAYNHAFYGGTGQIYLPGLTYYLFKAGPAVRSP